MMRVVAPSTPCEDDDLRHVRKHDTRGTQGGYRILKLHCWEHTVRSTQWHANAHFSAMPSILAMRSPLEVVKERNPWWENGMA